MSGFTPTFQLRGFGGPSDINGNTPASAGGDGAVLFPLGNRILVGPTGGFNWINSSIVQTIGSQQAGSTFINTSVGFKQGNFGGQIEFPYKPIDIGIHGGASVVNSSITQQSGFCGLGNATSPSGCNVTSTTNTSSTGIGSFVGGYISHSIFPHVGIVVGYDYHFLPTISSPSGSSLPSINVHSNQVVAGITLDFATRLHR